MCDNASNNDTVVSELEMLMPDAVSGSHTRIRCICHIFNLVVKVTGLFPSSFGLLLSNSFQAILSQFRQAKSRICDATDDSREEEDSDEEGQDEGEDEEGENMEEESDDELDPDREASDKLEIRDIGWTVDRIQKVSTADVLLGRSAVSKVTNTSPLGVHALTCRYCQISKLATRIARSLLMTDDLAECCKKAGIASTTIKRPVPTRWNSVAEMLRSAIQLRIPLDKLVLIDRHNTNAKSRIKKFKLKKEEWDLLVQLEPILVVST